MSNAAAKLRRIDWILFFAVAVLVALGLLAIWSVDLAQDAGHFFNFKKQLVLIVAGLALMPVLILVDYRAFSALARQIYIFGAVLLGAVLFFGLVIRGTRGWFALGPFTFQPVELARVILIVVLAKYFSVRAHIVDFKVLLGAGLLTGLYAALTVAQPDFGSALILLAVMGGMALFTKVPKRYIIAGVIILAIVGVLVWGLVLQDYQKARITTFLNPDADPFGSGYNIRQSVIAVGSGGLFGRGLGEGSQSQLRFLPEAQTDFIFAVLAEQLGFFAVVLIFAAYGVIAWRLLALIGRLSDGFAMFFTAGFFVSLAVQIAVNIGMNLGVVPIVGLPLPFVSLGGSALLANFLLLGIAQSISVRV